MGWNLPANPVAFTIATVAGWGQKVRDSLEYLKGLAGPVTIEDDVTVQGDIAVTGTVDGIDAANHSARHENGGADEISVLGLSGLLADGQTPLGHKASHENGGADEPSVAGLSGLLADAQNPVVHGAAEHTDITREVFVPAYGNIGGTPSAQGRFFAIQLTDGADLGFWTTMKVPDDFASFTKVELVWVSTAAAGNMRWFFDVEYAAATEARNTHTDFPAVGETATGGTNILNVQESVNPLTLANLAQGDYIGIYMQRVGTHINDTLNAHVYVIGVLFTYTANQ